MLVIKKWVGTLGMFLVLLSACGGGHNNNNNEDGDNDDQSSYNSSTVECDEDGECIRERVFTEGDFLVSVYDTDNAQGQPDYDVREEQGEVIVSCTGDETSEETYLVIGCTADTEDNDLLYNIVCYRGFVQYQYFQYDYYRNEEYFLGEETTDCQSQTLYCDDQGFDISPVCHDEV